MAFRKTNKPNSTEEASLFAEQAQQAAQLPIITEEQAALLLQISLPQMVRLRIKYNLPHFKAGVRLVRYDRLKLFEALQCLDL